MIQQVLIVPRLALIFCSRSLNKRAEYNIASFFGHFSFILWYIFVKFWPTVWKLLPTLIRYVIKSKQISVITLSCFPDVSMSPILESLLANAGMNCSLKGPTWFCSNPIMAPATLGTTMHFFELDMMTPWAPLLNLPPKQRENYSKLLVTKAKKCIPNPVN